MRFILLVLSLFFISYSCSVLDPSESELKKEFNTKFMDNEQDFKLIKDFMLYERQGRNKSIRLDLFTNLKKVGFSEESYIKSIDKKMFIEDVQAERDVTKKFYSKMISLNISYVKAFGDVVVIGLSDTPKHNYEFRYVFDELNEYKGECDWEFLMVNNWKVCASEIN